MKQIKLQELNKIAIKEAVFFINKEILFKKDTETVIIKIDSIINYINIKNIFLDNDLLIIEADSNFDFKDNFSLVNLKIFLSFVDYNFQKRMLKSFQWLTWNNESKFCGVCGSKTIHLENKIEKKCDVCNVSLFPKLSPAVLVLITKGEEILLTRTPFFRKGVYSAIAGFVDIGESAEDAVVREVKEEVGLTVDSIEYFGSQGWPFPNNFMTAFRATTVDTEIKIDENELEDAKWFNIYDLPELPFHSSISRKLIDNYVAKFL